MIWEYLLLAVIVIWAIFYLWRTFVQKGGCSCSSCPSARKEECTSEEKLPSCSLEGFPRQEEKEKKTR